MVPTPDALRFVGEPTWAALSGQPVTVTPWENVHEVPHVRLGQEADLVFVAPATADLLARAAAGMSGDLLTAVLLTARCPVVFAPGHAHRDVGARRDPGGVATLRSRGAVVLDPAAGRLTGADSGPGRLPDPAELVRVADRLLARGAAGLAADLAGRRRGQRRRHQGGTRPGPVPRQLVVRAAGLRARPRPRPRAAPRSPWSRPTPRWPTRRASMWCGSISAAELREAMLDGARRGRGRDGRGGRRLPAGRDRPAKIKKTGGRRRSRSSWPRTRTSCASWPGRGRPGQVIVGFAAETGDTCWPTGGPSWPPRAVICWWSTRSGGGLAFGTDDNAAVILAADGAHRRRRVGPKEVLADFDLGRGRRAATWLTAAGAAAKLSGSPTRGNVRSQVAGRLFTSESVTEGHPDKIADQISDAILDAMLDGDPNSRVAVETMITTGQVHVAGEVTTETYVDIPDIIREKILDIGYDSSAKGFDGASCGVSVSIGSQSPDIAQGVSHAFEHRAGEGADELDRQGAGDQGMMFGYACQETPELMPLPIMLAHRLSRQMSVIRRDGTVPYLRPDGKTQVTIEYDGIRPVRLDTVVVSTQHAPPSTWTGCSPRTSASTWSSRCWPAWASSWTPRATACWSTRPAGSRWAGRWATPA